MKISIWDTLQIEFQLNELIDFLKLIKNQVLRYFGKTRDPKIKSLIRDIIKYFDNFCKELQAFTKWTPNQECKILLWLKKDSYWKMSFKNLLMLANDKSNPLFVWIDNYKKNWEYRELFNDCSVKLRAYWSVLKQCFDDYWIKKHEEDLKRERELLDEFFTDNLTELEKWYVDFITATYYPSLTNKEKKIVVDSLYKKQEFKKYIPIIKRFLDKLDKRISK